MYAIIVNSDPEIPMTDILNHGSNPTPTPTVIAAAARIPIGTEPVLLDDGLAAWTTVPNADAPRNTIADNALTALGATGVADIRGRVIITGWIAGTTVPLTKEQTINVHCAVSRAVVTDVFGI